MAAGSTAARRAARRRRRTTHPPGMPGAAPAARSSAARLAGLPDLDFLRCGACWRPRLPGPDPPPGRPGIPGTPPPLAICFIIFCASPKRSSSWLTSEVLVPEPLAMRARREPLICLGWLRSNGVIEKTIASTRSNSFSSKASSWARIWPMPGIMPRIDFSEPIFLMAAICWRKSSKVKSSAARNLRSISAAWSRVERLLGLLDQGEHVAHVEDARRHPVGVEDLEVLHALAGAGEHDRAAGDRGDRQGRTTAGVAVELGEHDAGDVDALLEGVGGLDGGLADHRVDDEQHLVGLDRGADVGGLLHEVGVDGEAAGGVDDDDVVLRAAGLLDAGARDGDRVAVAAGALAASR